jgi:FkbH-like protein
MESDLLIISDFNVQNLIASCAKQNAPIHALAAPYGQLMQTLLARDAWTPDLRGAIVWSLPQSVSANYRAALRWDPINIDELLAEVDQFGHALTSIPNHVQHIFVPTWTATPPGQARRGPLDMDGYFGIAAALMRMNLKLAEIAAQDARITVFDSSRWIAGAGERAYDARLWYLAKTPFSAGVFKHAASDFAAALRGRRGRARKLLIVDADDTLWGGVVGDIGWENLRLGGHDAAGEAFRDFQLALKALVQRGILIALVSKNEESVVREAIESHPEMVLRLEDFAGWRINWNDKAQNIVELARILNFGLDSAVFIDDHPVERDRIRAALPEVIVPEWPQNPVFFVNALHELDCFDSPVVSGEDRQRTSMYVSERRRQEAQHAAPSMDEWLASLGLTISVEELTRANLDRTVQLLNKTNQMNLRTRRMSLQEMARWTSDRRNRLLIFRVSDKFGDYGRVGIAGLRIEQDSSAQLTDFVLSCRVMGRRVEEAMLHVVSEVSRGAGATVLSAEYIPTARNRPCLAFFEQSRMKGIVDSGRFLWDLTRAYPLPATVTLSSAIDQIPDARESASA